LRIGHETAPRLTAVAVPEPDTVPRRKPLSVTVRPGAVRERPNTEKLKSMKKRPAPVASSTAP
jgi:hypothetical protein